VEWTSVVVGSAVGLAYVREVSEALNGLILDGRIEEALDRTRFSRVPSEVGTLADSGDGD